MGDMAGRQPPVGRPGEPPKPTDPEQPAQPATPLPTTTRWTSFGACSHDPVCRRKLYVAGGIGILVVVGIMMVWSTYTKEPAS